MREPENNQRMTVLERNQRKAKLPCILPPSFTDNDLTL